MSAEVSTIWQLIVNLLSGLVGAAVGFIGAMKIERDRENRRRQGLIAAILFEIRLNNANMVSLIKNRNIHYSDLHDSAWLSVRNLLGEFVEPATLNELWKWYSDIDRKRRAASDLASQAHDGGAAEAIGEWLTGLNGASRLLLSEPAAADLRKFFAASTVRISLEDARNPG